MTTTLDDRDVRVALADASLDAPRVDLWQRLEQPVGELRRPTRRVWGGLRAVAAMLAVVLAGAGMLAVVTQLAPEHERVARGGSVPDLLLMESYDQQAMTYSAQAYLPGSNQLLPLAGGANIWGKPLIAPDGTQLIYVQREQVGDAWQLSLLALASDTLATQWSVPLASQPVEVPEMQVWVYQVATADRVYGVIVNWNTSDPLTIVALDRADGREAQRWSIDLGDGYLSSLSILLSPDGTTLHLLPMLASQPPAQGWSETPTLGYLQYHLPDMREQQRLMPLTSTSAAPYWFDRQTPDGRTLWGFSYDGGLGIIFFDTATGTLDGPLKIDLKDNVDWLYEHAVSPDGTKLYAFNPVNGRLAIVDLVGRQVLQELDVDMSQVQSEQGSLVERIAGTLRGWFAQDAAAKYYMQGTMQFSPDGTRLYALGASGSDYGAQPAGILVIDTINWQVLDHWLPDSQPLGIILGRDGRYLYAHSTEWSGSTPKGSLSVIDTATGEPAFTVDAGSGAIYSTAELYQEAYGTRPDLGEARAPSKRELARQKPFAKLLVTTGAATLVAGDTVSIEARFVDPRSGDTVEDGDDDVRYSPPDHIRAVLTRGSDDEDAVTVVLTSAGFGVYHGAALLTEPGIWDVRVISERAGEPNRHAALTGGITVQPAFAGSDGRRYALAIHTDPAAPVADQPVTVVATLVDVETGAVMPAGVTLAGGMPELLAASFFIKDSLVGGVTTATLTPTAHGVYSGTARLFASGNWAVQVNVPQAGAPVRSVQVGVIIVDANPHPATPSP